MRATSAVWFCAFASVVSNGVVSRRAEAGGIGAIHVPSIGGLHIPSMGGFHVPHIGGFHVPSMGGFHAPHIGGFEDQFRCHW